jgi:hypothetical protein
MWHATIWFIGGAWPDNALADVGSRVLQMVGSLLGLQGATIDAIGSKSS